jgi:hypothetical protein
VMHELSVSSLANITRTTRETGTVRWLVKLFAEGLASRGLHGESLGCVRSPHPRPGPGAQRKMMIP